MTHSGGGLISVETASEFPVRLVASGLAGGANSAADIARGEVNCEITAFMHHAGQGWEIPVPLPDRPFGGDGAAELADRFRTGYQRFFGRAIDGLDGLEIEVVTWSVKATDDRSDGARHEITTGKRFIEPTTTRTVFDPAAWWAW